MKSTTALAVIDNDHPTEPRLSTLARAARLAEEAKLAVTAEVDRFGCDLANLVARADELAECELASVGVREFCRTLAARLLIESQVMNGLLAREQR